MNKVKFNVNKFGGTSVGTSSAIKQVAEILLNESNSLAVLSACSGITNKLMQIADNSLGNLNLALKLIDEIEDFHLILANELAIKMQVENQIKEVANDLRTFAKGINLLGEKQVSVENRILAKGEILSTYIFHSYLVNILKIESSLIFAPDFLIFDGLDYSLINQLELQKELSQNKICVTQGFIANNQNKQITNLGRGGSDWSAAIFGASLGAAKINIWTDVDGILTSDPRIVAEANLINEIDYESIKIAAFLGAKVLHPATIAPAMKLGIDVCIRNTFNLRSKGSLINNDCSDKNVVIVTKENICLVKASKCKEINTFLLLLAEANIDIYYEQVFAEEIQIFIDNSNPKLGFILDNYLPIGSVVELCNLISAIETGDVSSTYKKNNFDISALLGIFKKVELTLYVAMANERAQLFFIKTNRLKELTNLLYNATNKAGASGY